MREMPKIPTTEAEAAAFIEWCVDNIGGGFHPDTPAHDYTVTATGEPTFTDEQATALDLALDEVFALLDDPYAITIDAMKDKDY